MADPVADYYHLRVRARAEFDEPAIETPVVSFQLNFALDDVPTAVIRIPLGRDPVTGKVSSALGTITDIEPRTRCRVYAYAESLDGRFAPPGKDPGFPETDTLVFDGFVASPKVVRGVNTASLEIELFGVQAGLAGSTMLINSVTRADLISSNSNIVVKAGGGAVAWDIIAALARNPVEDDLWSIGILPVMTQAVFLTSAWTSLADNGAAQASLKRINKGNVLEIKPLKLSVHNAPTALLRQTVARTLGNHFYNTWASNTGQGDMWNVLMTLRNLFLFHFVPAVNEDALAPITPNLGGKPYRTLDPNEYNQSLARSSEFSWSDYAYRATVGLYAKTFRTPQWDETSGVATKLGVATVAHKLMGQKGMIQLVQAPEWLIPSGAPAEHTVGKGGAVPDASNPDVPAEHLAYGDSVNKFLESTLGNSVAATDLYEKLFLHRGSLEISGRLRMDISPGSLIKVNAPGERFSGKKDVFYGMVSRVSVYASAGDGSGGAAGTSLNLVSVRSEREHETLTTPYHPLYQQTWVGGRLL
jgi:hypothetical protein